MIARGNEHMPERHDKNTDGHDNLLFQNEQTIFFKTIKDMKNQN